MAKKTNMGTRLGDSLPEPSAVKDDMNDYETQGHLRTLIDAENIKSDPEKMAKVHKLAGRHADAIKSIRDLKDTYDHKFGSGSKKPI